MAKGICSVPDCESPVLVVARGYCSKHVQKFYLYGDPLGRPPKRAKAPLIDQFAARVSPTNDRGCRLWTGTFQGDGYGLFWTGERQVLAHRWIYESVVGPIPRGLEMRHSCDTPACVAVAHLTPGTHAENMMDMRVRGRSYDRRGERCPSAKLTAADVVEIRVAHVRGMTFASLGRQYGVSEPTIAAAVRRKTWAHVT